MDPSIEPGTRATAGRSRALSVSPFDEHCDMEGFLTKMGGFIKSWKRRWFTLKYGVLRYYKEGEVRRSFRSISIPQCLTLLSLSRLAQETHQVPVSGSSAELWDLSTRRVASQIPHETLLPISLHSPQKNLLLLLHDQRRDAHLGSFHTTIPTIR